MRSAILAWGSLVWDPGDLKVAAEFLANGPLLPIEFCRVADDGRLTLVVDENFGSVCTTYSAPSALENLDAAIDNLSLRERTRAREVGFVELASGRQGDIAMQRHPEAVAAISAWATSNGYDAAIWAALACNFDEPDKGGEPFSVTAAIGYLEALKSRDAEKFAGALAYIRNAPIEVETPVRDQVNKRWPA